MLSVDTFGHCSDDCRGSIITSLDEYRQLAVQHFQKKLAHFELIATGTTGLPVQEATGLPVNRYLSGPLGGDAQIAAHVAMGDVKAVIFWLTHCTPTPMSQILKACCAFAMYTMYR